MDERKDMDTEMKREKRRRGKGLEKGGGEDQKIHRQADSIKQGKRNKRSADARVATLQWHDYWASGNLITAAMELHRASR